MAGRAGPYGHTNRQMDMTNVIGVFGTKAPRRTNLTHNFTVWAESRLSLLAIHYTLTQH